MINNRLKTEYNKLNLNEIFELLRICADDLGLVDMENAINILGKKKRRIYQLMNENNSLEIGSHKFPLINLMLK